MAIPVNIGNSSLIPFIGTGVGNAYLNYYGKVKENLTRTINDLTYAVPINYGEVTENMRRDPRTNDRAINEDGTSDGITNSSYVDQKTGEPLFLKADRRYDKPFYTVIDKYGRMLSDYIDDSGTLITQDDLGRDFRYHIDQSVPNQTTTPSTPLTLLNDSGAGPMVPGGLWNSHDTPNSSPAVAWYYGQSPAHTYNTGVTNSGNLTSPVLNLSDTNYAYALQFQNNYQTEPNNISNLIDDNVETGNTLPWTPTGLWNINNNTANTPTNSWYYGQAGINDYDTGAITTGSLTSPTLNLSDATATYTLKFAQSFNTEPNTPVTVTLLDDNVEDIAGSNTTWTESGLWNIHDGNSNSPSHAWYYGLPCTETYDQTGNRTFGSIESPAYDLSNTDFTYTFSYSHMFSTETINPSDYDLKFVEYSLDGGTNWTEVQKYNTSYQDWTQESYIIPNGSANTKIRFRFDTIDGAYNNFTGWYVDDMKLSGTRNGRNGFDMKYVDYSSDNGATWSTLATYNSPDQTWATSYVTVPAGSTNSKIRFRFDSVDNKYNDYRGWNVDDIKLITSKPRNGFDRKIVEYNTGSGWNVLKEFTESDSGGWGGEMYALPSGSATTQVRFRFDTVDNFFNNYRGWNVDDIQVIGAQPDDSSVAMDEGVIRFKPLRSGSDVYPPELEDVTANYGNLVTPKKEEMQNQVYNFGRTFKLAAGASDPSSISVSMNDGGNFQLFVNGALVGESGSGTDFAPANPSWSGNIASYLKVGTNEIVVKAVNPTTPVRVSVNGIIVDTAGKLIPVSTGPTNAFSDLWSVSKYSASGTAGQITFKSRVGGALYTRQDEIVSANIVLEQLSALIGAETDTFNSLISVIK